MKTKKMKFIPIEEAITTSKLADYEFADLLLKFTTVNQSQRRALLIGRAEYGEFGFERKSDWTRFVNKMNGYDYGHLKSLITGKNRFLDYGDYIISRADIEYSEDGFFVEFKEPVDFAIEEIGDKFATIKVKKLLGKFTYEWFFTRNPDIDVANICEIYIYDTKIIE